MARHLTKADIEAIVDIVNSLTSEKVSWEEICCLSEAVIGKKPTRQSLYSKQPIRDAYKAKKRSLRLGKPHRAILNDIDIAADRIMKLKNEIQNLRQTNSSLLEKFIIWQYNAYKYGVSEHQLNEPLPKINR